MVSSKRPTMTRRPASTLQRMQLASRAAVAAAGLALCCPALAQEPRLMPTELGIKKCRIGAAISAHRMGLTVIKIEVANTDKQDGRYLRLTVRLTGEIAGEKAVFSAFCLQTDDMRMVSELTVIE